MFDLEQFRQEQKEKEEALNERHFLESVQGKTFRELNVSQLDRLNKIYPHIVESMIGDMDFKCPALILRKKV